MNSVYNIIDIIEKDKVIYDLLKACPFEILKCWSIVTHKKDETILFQGRQCDDFLIIVNGLVDINITTENGKKYSQAIYVKGNYLGELEIFDGLNNCCNAEAITDVVLLKINRDDFLKWMEMDRNISWKLTKSLSLSFYKLSLKAGSDKLYSLKYRLCDFLLHCMEESYFVDNKMKLTIKNTNISGYLGVTDRSINRVVKELKEKGIVEVINGYIMIKNKKALLYELEDSKRN